MDTYWHVIIDFWLKKNLVFYGYYLCKVLKSNLTKKVYNQGSNYKVKLWKLFCNLDVMTHRSNRFASCYALSIKVVRCRIIPVVIATLIQRWRSYSDNTFCLFIVGSFQARETCVRKMNWNTEDVVNILIRCFGQKKFFFCFEAFNICWIWNWPIPSRDCEISALSMYS